MTQTTNRLPPGEIQIGAIRHRTKHVPKGIEMLRLDRELKPILDAWRDAMKRNPEEWGIKE